MKLPTLLLVLLLIAPGLVHADAPPAQIDVVGQAAIVLPNAPWTTTIAIHVPQAVTHLVTVTVLVSATMTIEIDAGVGVCAREDDGWRIWTVCRFTDPPPSSLIQMLLTRAPLEAIQAEAACDRPWQVGTPVAIAIDAAPVVRATAFSPYQPGYCARMPIFAGG